MPSNIGKFSVAATIVDSAQSYKETLTEEAIRSLCHRNVDQAEIEVMRCSRTIVMADKLPHAQLMTIGESVYELVDKIKPIETEQVLGALPYITLPATNLWVEFSKSEGGIFSLIEPSKNGGFFIHNGVYSNQGNKEFLRYHVFPTTHVSPDGIRHEDSVLLKDMELMLKSHLRETKKKKRKAVLPDLSAKVADEIDRCYDLADFMVRLLVVMRSPKVASNFAQETPEAENARLHNIRRKQFGLEPKIDAMTPVIIDVTRTDPRLLQNEPLTDIRELLLGVTHVSASRLITRPDGSLWLRKKDGMPWSRKAHERAIPSPIDRTAAPRHATASATSSAQVIVEPGRPAQVRRSSPLHAANKGI